MQKELRVMETKTCHDYNDIVLGYENYCRVLYSYT